MSLSSASPTINALGIFGRLDNAQEHYFAELQDKYSEFTENDENLGIFPHLSLAVGSGVRVGEVGDYLDLLRELQLCLPLRIDVSDVIVVDDIHLALSFSLKQTEPTRDITKKFIPHGVIGTHYMKAVRSVPKQAQTEVVAILKQTKQLTFMDFVLCANSPNDASIIYSSSR